MATLNVNRNVNDLFYRYKMPKLIAKVEGKGNGIKTVIANMPEIAKCLSRPPEYPTKYFGCELGAQTQFDAKNARYIVNGAHDGDKLQVLLDGFIKKFVLCQTCQNPETDLQLEKNQNITQKCIACGARNPIDMRHKLTTFISKNPPETLAVSAFNGVSAKEVKKEKKPTNGNGFADANKANGGAHAAEGEFDGISPTTRSSDNEEENWSVDTSETAVWQRQVELNEKLGENVMKLALTDELELSENERLELYHKYASTSERTGNQLVDEAERLEVKDKALAVLFDVLFNEQILTQIPKQKKLLLRFTKGNRRAQRYLLGAVERFVGVRYRGLLNRTAHILKTLYDEDIVEESVILKWAEKPSKKHCSIDVANEVHKAAGAFVTWLKTAEEEESSEEESDDVDVVYEQSSSAADRLPAKTSSVRTPNSMDTREASHNASPAEDEDLDIDAI